MAVKEGTAAKVGRVLGDGLCIKGGVCRRGQRAGYSQRDEGRGHLQSLQAPGCPGRKWAGGPSTWTPVLGFKQPEATYVPALFLLPFFLPLERMTSQRAGPS